MNIGFVSTWFERGASYVTKAYLDLLKDDHHVYVYARGGEQYGKGNPDWDLPYVTWSPRLLENNINFHHFKSWITKNDLDVIFFNEQHQIDIVYQTKKTFPQIKLGSYIDYYKEDTVKEFYLYDFLICNTQRHFFVFQDHPQSYYVPWGTDTDLFTPSERPNQELTFFHSAGMSNRKGTTSVINAFIRGKVYENAKLLIHTQQNFEQHFGFSLAELASYHIDIIEKTVPAPGLYYLGDVYIYPTMLDGLGLTMYEALASGLPVITTNHPPMSEVINNNVGYLVDVDYLRSRSDGFYWPLAIVNETSLINAMNFYVNQQHQLDQFKREARQEAVQKWQWRDRQSRIKAIFEDTDVIVNNPSTEFIASKSMWEKVRRKLGSTYLYSFLNQLKH